MKYLYIKTKYKVIFILKHELVRQIYKSIIFSTQYPFLIRQFALFLFNHLGNFSFVCHRARGFFYGKSRFLLKDYKLSRMQLKLIANNAQILGVRRACW